MQAAKLVIATMELLLILPASLFMTALFVRNLEPLRYEPARSAARIVTWYSARPHLGLWVLLMALPLAVLVTGCGTLRRVWNTDVELQQAARHTLAAIRTHVAMLLVPAATLAAGCILAIVALYVVTD